MSAFRQQELISSVYPYSQRIPSVLSFILTAISFGIIGALGKTINDTIQKDLRLKEVPNLMLVPIQGGIIGIIILGISYTIPVLLTIDDVTLQPITIVFLSLFGGISYLNFYDWLTHMINQVIFSKEKNNKS